MVAAAVSECFVKGLLAVQRPATCNTLRLGKLGIVPNNCGNPRAAILFEISPYYVVKRNQLVEASKAFLLMFLSKISRLQQKQTGFEYMMLQIMLLFVQSWMIERASSWVKHKQIHCQQHVHDYLKTRNARVHVPYLKNSYGKHEDKTRELWFAEVLPATLKKNIANIYRLKQTKAKGRRATVSLNTPLKTRVSSGLTHTKHILKPSKIACFVSEITWNKPTEHASKTELCFISKN